MSGAKRCRLSASLVCPSQSWWVSPFGDMAPRGGEQRSFTGGVAKPDVIETKSGGLNWSIYENTLRLFCEGR